MSQKAANEGNLSLSCDEGSTVGIIAYNTSKVNEEGMIIIPRDVFRPKPKTWHEDYIAACLPYHPAFVKCCWDNDKKPILSHRLTTNTTKNRKSWGEFLRNDMFGNAFNAACKDGWNRGMAELMSAPKEDGDTGPGYNWRNHTPTTRNDILELLKGD